MKVSYDREADSMYIRLAEADVATNRAIDERTILDLDVEGEILGIELLDVSERFSSFDEFTATFPQAEKLTA